jgi:hypothetical protein
MTKRALTAAIPIAVAIGAGALTGTAYATPGRYALVIGANQGDRDEVQLRYAELDAQRIASVLRGAGRFFPENVAVMTGVSGEDVRRALISLNARLREASPGGALLFVFYSGHADAEALHLGGTRLALSELRDLSAGSAADARVLVVDSCRSGALTRVKGGRPGPSFDIRVDPATLPRGLAILTSSAAGEDAQESDELRASVFTHHLVSALLGAADRDANGRVTIDEAFGYAAERTLAATATTLAGPQHPTYRLEIGGRDDLTLTWPGASRDRGLLRFAQPGRYLVQRGGPDGPVVAELTSDAAGGRLAVEPGAYFVRERRPDFLRQELFVVAADAETAVDTGRMRRVEYARVVRKGTGDGPTHVVSALATGGMRGEMQGLGTAWRTGLGARLDLPNLSLEVQLVLGASERRNEWQTIRSLETGLALAGLRVFDLGALSVGLGLEAGLALFVQRFDAVSTPDRARLAPFFGPLLQLDVPVVRRFFLRAEAAFMTYLAETDARPRELAALSTFRAGGGAGVFF